MLFATNSLIKGYLESNFIGQGIVIIQLLLSVVMVVVAFGKFRQLRSVQSGARRFTNDFNSYQSTLDYYLQRRPGKFAGGMLGIYVAACERLLKIIAPDVGQMMASMNGNDSAVLNAREIELVKGSCGYALNEQERAIEKGMGWVATVVALSPMLGLLGTVWGVLDAFAEMGTAGSANLATIAPSISAALVTTVVGLIVAMPGVICFNLLNAMIRDLDSDMEGFADELNGRIACEFQGKGV